MPQEPAFCLKCSLSMDWLVLRLNQQLLSGDTEERPKAEDQDREDAGDSEEELSEVHRLSDSDIQISQGSPSQLSSVAAWLPDSAAYKEKATSPRSKLEHCKGCLCKGCLPKCPGRAKKPKNAQEPGATKASDESAKRSCARKQGSRGQVSKAVVIPKARTTARSAASVASDISDQQGELPSFELRGASIGLRERGSQKEQVMGLPYLLECSESNSLQYHVFCKHLHRCCAKTSLLCMQRLAFDCT